MADDAKFVSLRTTLQPFGQEHLLQCWLSLSDGDRARLASQISQIDFPQLHQLTQGEDQTPNWAELASIAESPIAIKLDESNPTWKVTGAYQAGEAALRASKVGMILAAGGQGTRLGFDHPKGMFPIGPISGRSLFAMHVDRLLAVSAKYGVSIPMYIMTSPATDVETREYFEKNRWFGAKEIITIFCQGSMPAVDALTGRVLLSTPSEIALSPDGHGGLVSALHKNGILTESEAKGIEYFFYAQVDNPLVEICDPALIGYHVLARSQMTTQVVKKRFALEKVGNVVSIRGRTQIIEYSDLPDQYAQQTNPDGSLKLWAGNIAVHLFDRTFLESVVAQADGLPFHRARKPVSFVGPDGGIVKPSQPNAIKFERFVFDLLPLAERTIVVEGDAACVFAPVKNADGAPTDTPLASKRAISNLHANWLRAAGATVSDGVWVEIHPSWALNADDVKSKLSPGLKVPVDLYLA